MTLVANINDLAARIGGEIKALRGEIGGALSVTELPASPAPDQIVEFRGRFYKWHAAPGAWVQVG